MLTEAVFQTARLCVVGNINRDIKTAPMVPGDYLFADGETPIDGVSETIGGGGANSAAIAAKLGAQVSFVGQVGDDALGRSLEAALTCAGVHCFLHLDREHPTGSTINLVFNDGHRHFLSCHPNNAAQRFESLDLSALEQTEHLLRADIWFSEAMLFGGNEKLFRHARELGVSTSIDLNWDPQWGRAPAAEIARRKDAVRGILPLVDLAHGNVRELCEFTDATELPAALERLQHWGVGAVVIHLGASGAGYFSNGEIAVAPPGPVQQRVLATGTGDVLSVCMMMLHHHKAAAPEKLRLANQIVAEFIEGKRQLIPGL